MFRRSPSSPRTSAGGRYSSCSWPHRPWTVRSSRPSGVPAERVAALRSAFHAAITDAGFIAEARRQHLQIAEVDGTRVTKVLSSAYALPADIVKAATEAMNVTASHGE